MSGFKRLNWHAFFMGLAALATVLIVACGGSEEPTVASVAPTTVGQPAEIAATAAPAAEATATPVSEAMTSARDTAIFVTNEEPTTLGAASANCGGNIQNTVCDDIASDPLTSHVGNLGPAGLTSQTNLNPKQRRTVELSDEGLREAGFLP